MTKHGTPQPPSLHVKQPGVVDRPRDSVEEDVLDILNVPVPASPVMLGPVVERTTSNLNNLMDIKQNRLLPVRKQQILDRTKALK
jgi:hypothetical protein